MSVVHKIASSCAVKLAQHVDELTGLVGNILPHVSSDDQGHLSSFLFLVATRLEPPTRRQAYINSLLQPLAQEFTSMRPLFTKAALPQQLLLCAFAEDADTTIFEQQHTMRTKVLGLLLTFVGVLRHAYNIDGHWGGLGGGGGAVAGAGRRTGSIRGQHLEVSSCLCCRRWRT